MLYDTLWGQINVYIFNLMQVHEPCKEYGVSDHCVQIFSISLNFMKFTDFSFFYNTQ